MPIRFREPAQRPGLLDREPAERPGLLDRQQRPLHAVLGGGKLADILLWEDKRSSAAIVAGFSIIWFLFEVVEYNFLTLLCHILMALMIILFVWYNAAGLITWSLPDIYDFEIPEPTFRYLHKRLNSFLRMFYDISTGKDLTLFFVTIAGLWIMSAIGSYFTTLNLLYFMFLCLVTLPIMYERYEYEVNYLASKGNQDVKRLFNTLDSKVLNKIPRGPVKEKKHK
ncbi:Reticulon protein B9 [Spatholobus suberectus]|nr:Reticulon protein B9 [Spatholobus suberectus]